MGVVIRQSFWASTITYLGVAVGYINSLILFPYFLDEEKFGLLRLVQSNGMILIPLAILGMNGAYVKFFPEFKENQTLANRIFSFQLLVVLLGSIIFSLIIYFFQGSIETFFSTNSSLYNDYLYVTVIIFVAQSLFNFFISFLWSKHNIILTNFLNEIFLRLTNTLIIGLYGFDLLSFSSMVFWIGMAYILTTLILFVYIWIAHKVQFDWRYYLIPNTWFRKLFSFGAYTMLVTSCASIILNISYPLTSSYIGLEANGILTISVYIGTVIELPKRSMLQIISPIITQNFNDNNTDEIKKNFQLSSINLGLLSLLLGIGICTNLESLFMIIPKGDFYSTGTSVIYLILIAKCISMLGGLSSTILNFSNYYKANIFITVFGALTMVGLNLLLIPRYGILGAGISILITEAINQTIRYFIIFYKLKILPFTKAHPIMIAMASVIFLLTFYLPRVENPIFDILYKSTIISIVFLSTTYFLRLSYHFNHIVDSGIEYLTNRR